MISYLTPPLLARLKDSKCANERLEDCDRAIRREIERFMRMRLEYLEHFANTLLQAEHHENRIRESHERKAVEKRKLMESSNSHSGSFSGPGGTGSHHPLKSCIKRGTSNHGKHVTFSSDPPQVKDIESPSLSDWEAQDALDSAPENESFYDSESDQYESSTEDLSPKSQPSASKIPTVSESYKQLEMTSVKVATSPEMGENDNASTDPYESQTAVVLYEDKPGKPQLRAGRDFTLDIRRLPIDAMPENQPHSPAKEPSKPAAPYPISDLTQQPKQSDAESAVADGQGDLTFDLLLDGTETENTESELADTPDGAGHKNFDGTTDIIDKLDVIDDPEMAYAHSSLIPKNERTPTEAASVVGSAPIDIHLTPAMDQRKRGLSHDGGPRPNVGSMALLAEEEESVVETLSLSRHQSEKAIDPANMSFSQRMVWEEHQR